ncbi:MAG: neutral zinc metallopeptidase [Pirellulales bacterium]|nr:neutral zinc metallopeptidase [Pirellulales bacterium]
MRWQGRRESENVEDRRRMSGGKMVAGGGIGTLVVILLISAVFGINPMQLLQQMPQPQGGGGAPVQQGPIDPRQEKQKEFVAVVLADSEDIWSDLFKQIGRVYRKPKLVLFNRSVQSACGFASAATGPFYCPEDEKVYIDLSFFDEMQSRLGAKGDFARAYVLAHEIGHHVQKQLGTTDQVHRLRRQLSEEQYNQLSVRLELQADYLAGVFSHYLNERKNILEPGDIEEALNAANAIGDDRLQREAQGYVVPDSFTHGTSAQRMRWFMKGYESGDPEGGDTFEAEEL